MLREAKADALTDARLNNEFLGRGFADLQALLESGFRQLEKFYVETGHTSSAPSHLGAGITTTGTGTGPRTGTGTANAGTGDNADADAFAKADRRGTGTGSGDVGTARGSGDTVGQYRSAVEETMASLREETSAAMQRQRAILEALRALNEVSGALSVDTTFAEATQHANDDAFFSTYAEEIETKLRQSRVLRDELARTERQRDELSRQVRGKPLHPPRTHAFNHSSTRVSLCHLCFVPGVTSGARSGGHHRRDGKVQRQFGGRPSRARPARA